MTDRTKEEITKKSPDELFLESLPIEYEDLTAEQSAILKNLEKRKQIVFIKDQKIIGISITDLGKKIISLPISEEHSEKEIYFVISKIREFFKY